MKPLSHLEIRDLNREIEERLASLKTLEALAVVRSFKGQKCYGLGLSLGRDLILRNLVRFLGGVFRAKPTADTAASVTLTDITNTERTVNVATTSLSGFTLFNWMEVTAQRGRMGAELAFGNPASTPTPARTDYELESLVARFSPSSVSTDETNWRITQTGSYVWTAGGTVRETGMSAFWGVSLASPYYYTFLLYHDAVTDVEVGAGGTVSVTYTTQL